MENEIHLTDFPSNTYILIEKELRKNVIKRARINLECENYNQLAKILNGRSIACTGRKSKFTVGDIKLWIKGKRKDLRTNIVHPKCMPLWTLLELVKLSGTKLYDIEKHVLLYRTNGHGKPVHSPKLPIYITPEFESIVVHLFADGYAGNFTPSYCQYDKQAREMFIQKLKNCFGGFKVSMCERFSVRFPKIITDILTKHYNIKSFHSFKADIPSIMFESSRLHKLALVVAFIQDEGNIREVINFTSANLKLLSQIKKLTEICSYKCNPIKHHPTNRVYRFNMSNKDIEKFAQDVKALENIFPTCSLFKKSIALKRIIDRKNWRTKGNINTQILGVLRNNELTVQEVMGKVGCTYNLALKKLKKLLWEGKIKRKKLANRSFVWYIS